MVPLRTSVGTCLLLRARYAATTLKYAGAELEHVTLYLDAPLVPGAVAPGH